MNIRFFFTLFALACLSCAAAAQWPGPSLYPYTERVVEHIPADYDPAHILPMMLCPDANYLPHAGVTVTSLLENANKAYAYDIYIVSDKQLTDQQKAPWLELAEQYADAVDFNFTFMDGSALIDTQQIIKGVWGSTALYRLVAPEMDTFAQYDQIIYIDCDMIVYDIIPFWTQSFDLEEGEEAWFAAVKDDLFLYPDRCPLVLRNLIQRMPQLEEDPQFVCEDYINSGLLLMNLKELRMNHFAQAALQFIREKKPPWPDQDAINALAFKRLKRLEFKYAYPFMLTNSKPDGTFVLHYVGGVKPWNKPLPAYGQLISSLSQYHFYRQKSPWAYTPTARESSPPREEGTRAAAIQKWRDIKAQKK